MSHVVSPALSQHAEQASAPAPAPPPPEPTPPPPFDFVAASQHPYHGALLSYVTTAVHAESQSKAARAARAARSALVTVLRAQWLGAEIPGGAPGCSAVDTVCQAIRRVLHDANGDEDVGYGDSGGDIASASDAADKGKRDGVALIPEERERARLAALGLLQKLVQDVPRFFAAVAGRTVWPAVRWLALRRDSSDTTARARLLVRGWAAGLGLQFPGCMKRERTTSPRSTRGDSDDSSAATTTTDAAERVARFVIRQAAQLRAATGAPPLPAPLRPWVCALDGRRVDGRRGRGNYGTRREERSVWAVHTDGSGSLCGAAVDEEMESSRAMRMVDAREARTTAELLESVLRGQDSDAELEACETATVVAARAAYIVAQLPLCTTGLMARDVGRRGGRATGEVGRVDQDERGEEDELAVVIAVAVRMRAAVAEYKRRVQSVQKRREGGDIVVLVDGEGGTVL